MTIVNAFKEFFYKLNGTTPSGNNIADVVRNGASGIQLNEVASKITLSSSTADSTKMFDITVDDSGNVTATEVVAGS